MKVSCVRVGTELLIGKKQDSIINKLAKELISVGAVLESYITTPNTSDKIFSALKFSENSKIIFVIGETTTSKNHSIKKLISQHFNLELEVNHQAKQNVENYYSKINSTKPNGVEQEFYLPAGAKAFAYDITDQQSFVVEINDRVLFYMPDNENVIKFCFNNYIQNYIKNVSNPRLETQTVKVFGLSEQDIYKQLSDMLRNEHNVLFITFPNGLDTALVLRYNENLDKNIVSTYIQKVYEKLNKYIYASSETSLAKYLTDLLSVSNKTISVVETVSAGKITNMILKEEDLTEKSEGDLEAKNENNSNKNINLSYLKHSVVLPNLDDANKFLNLNRNIINTHGAISVEGAYEIAATMLEKSGSDYVLCTCAEQVKNNKDSKKTVYIAVGDQDGIHVYKNNFTGNKEQLIKSISQTSLFYLIKNIKQKGLLFSEIIV